MLEQRQAHQFLARQLWGHRLSVHQRRVRRQVLELVREQEQRPGQVPVQQREQQVQQVLWELLDRKR